jgi:hypothetical protein
LSGIGEEAKLSAVISERKETDPVEEKLNKKVDDKLCENSAAGSEEQKPALVEKLKVEPNK